MRLDRGRDLSNPSDTSGDDSERSDAWADGDLRKSGENLVQKNRALGLAPTAFGIAAPPPPAAAMLDPGADEDPVESLFRADQTLRAPSIPAAPSEAEVTRWRATVRNSSMFDEQVSDPMPGDGEPLRAPSGPLGNNLELAIDPRIAARARARAEALAAVAPAPPPPAPPAAGVAEPVAPPRRRPVEAALAASAEALQPPEPVAAPRRTKSAGARSGVRSKSESLPGLAVEPPAVQHGEPHEVAGEEPDETPLRRRRLQRGPGPVMLAVLAAAAVVTFGSAAVVIGLAPNPFADPPAPIAASPQPAPAAKPRPAKPAAVAKTEPKAAPVAAAKPTSPAAPAKAPAAAEVIPAQLPSKETKAAAAAVAPQAPAPQRVAAAEEEPMLVVAPEEAAQPAAKPVKAEPAASPVASGNAASTSALLTAARKALADDEPARAEAAMRQVLETDPLDHHAMELLVRALMDQDRGAEAVPFARKMVQRRAKRVPYRLLLGDVLLMVGDEAGARAEWQAALALEPNDREIRRRLGL
jgi:hypothetical protein